MKYYYDLLDSYSKVKKRKLYLLEDLEQTDPDTFSKLQSAENTAKNLITNATEEWKPIPQMAGLEMKRSVSRSQINKGVVIKGLGHGWAHGIKVIDDNGMPIGSIQDLRSPWGRFVAKLLPELDPDNMPEEEGAGGAGAEEEMIGPDGQPIRPDYDVEQQTVARIKDIVCRSVEPLQSFLHRLKNKYDNFKNFEWSSNDTPDSRDEKFAYSSKYISKQICDMTEEALSTRFRNLKGFVSKGKIKRLVEDYVIPVDQAEYYATNYYGIIDAVKTSKYLEDENILFDMADKFSLVVGDSPQTSFVIFNSDDGITGAAMSQESSPILFDLLKMIKTEVEDKYAGADVIPGIKEIKEDKIKYTFRHLGLEAEKFSRLIALVSNSFANEFMMDNVRDTLLEIMNKAGGEIIIGLNNVARYSLTDLDTLENVYLVDSLKKSFGYIDGMSDEDVKDFVLHAHKDVKLQWTADQARDWVKNLLIGIVKINSKGITARRPRAVAEVGTNIFLGSKTDVIEYYPPGYTETILTNQGVPPEVVDKHIKREQSVGNLGSGETLKSGDEVFGTGGTTHDSVNFSLKTMFSPTETTVHLGGYKYDANLKAMKSFKDAQTATEDKFALALKGMSTDYSDRFGLDESYMGEVVDSLGNRLMDVQKIFSVGLGKMMDKEGTNLEADQKKYIMGLIDSLIDKDIFESGLSFHLKQIKSNSSKELREKDIVDIAGALFVQRLKYDVFSNTDPDIDKQKRAVHSLGMLALMNGGCADPTLMQVTDIPNTDLYLVSQNELVYSVIDNITQAIDRGENVLYMSNAEAKRKGLSVGPYSIEFTKDNRINFKGPHMGEAKTSRPLNYVSIYYSAAKFDNKNIDGETITSLKLNVEANREYIKDQDYYKQTGEFDEMLESNIASMLDSILKEESIWNLH